VRQFTSLTDPNLIACLNSGGVVVLPSDTIYGVMARAADQLAVERVYRLRGRAPEKPCIILAADRRQIADDSLWTPKHAELAQHFWPGSLSLVTPVTAKTPAYLHRGTLTLAYRIPDYPELRRLLEATGPLIAPSANPEGQPPAVTVAEAQVYFGEHVDGYVDGGDLADHSPSTVVAVEHGQPKVLRQGAVHIDKA
jgi:L-threonylcarbamoyladenylate synthase